MRLTEFYDSLPPVTKNIIMINIVVWLVTLVAPRFIGIDLNNLLALHYFAAPDFNIAQLLTYMFMHSDQTFAHVFFNMFSLFMFGFTIERTIGSSKFLFFYISCGIGAALCQEAVWALSWESIVAGWNSVSVDYIHQAAQQMRADGQPIPILNAFQTVGASGCVFGVYIAFAMLFPNREIFLMFPPMPVKAKWMIAGFCVIELLLGLSAARDGIAHFAHLGGALFGFLIILYWKKKGAVYGDPF